MEARIFKPRLPILAFVWVPPEMRDGRKADIRIGMQTQRLSKLAVLTAPSIDTASPSIPLFMGRLAVNTKSNSGNRLAPGLWNWRATFIAVRGTLAHG